MYVDVNVSCKRCKNNYIYTVDVSFLRYAPYNNVHRTIYIFSDKRINTWKIREIILKDASAEKNFLFNIPTIGALADSWVKQLRAIGGTKKISIASGGYHWGDAEIFRKCVFSKWESTDSC